MAPVFHIDLSSTTGSNDPLGIAGVTSFYGPGTWGAWVLTVVASWIHMRKHEDAYLLHPIGHMLYTNWAAIDIIRQLASQKNKNTGSVGAAFLVTYWGLCQTSLQLLYCMTKDRGSSRPGTQRRYFALVLGLVLPSITGLYFLLRVFLASDVAKPYDEGSALVPALYHDGIKQSFHQWNMVIAAYFMVNTAILLCLALGDSLRTRVLKGVWKVDENWAFYPALMGPLSMICLSLSTCSYIFKVISSGGGIMRKSCYFMPCSPQKISESDQSFALFVALALFSYEFGFMIMMSLRTKATRIGRRIGWMPRNDFHD
jgi:hypothetical protein